MRTLRAHPGATLVITSVNVMDGTGQGSYGPTDVQIVNGRIASLEPSQGRLPDGALDGHGKFLIPGLWETEAHLTRYSNGIPADMLLDWSVAGDRDRVASHLRSYLAHGVTTVVDLGGPPEVLGPIRDQQCDSSVTGARLLMVGRQFTAVNGRPILYGQRLTSVTTEVDGPRQARECLRRDIERYDLDAVKANYTVGGGPHSRAPMISRDTLAVLVEEAHANDLPVLVHIDDVDAAMEAVEVGVDNVEHMFAPRDGSVRADVERLTERCLAYGAYWPFTLVTWESVTRAGDPSYLDALHLDQLIPQKSRHELENSPDSVWNHVSESFRRHSAARYEAAMEFVAFVHSAGVKMTVATDSGNPMVFHGPGTIREMELMAQAGIAPADAIVAATRLSAEKLRVAQDIGTIEPGKVADVVLLDADPTEDIKNLRKIHAVIQSGVVHKPRDLVTAGSS